MDANLAIPAPRFPIPRLVAPPRTKAARTLRDARSCYDHLAGRLGVAVTDAMAGRGLIAPDPVNDRLLVVTQAGARWFADFGVDTAPAAGRRIFARPCLDWTERRPHLAGALGARLLSRLLALGWVVRMEGGRGLRLTLAGVQGFKRALGVELDEVSADSPATRATG